jgi:hypothetical protein
MKIRIDRVARRGGEAVGHGLAEELAATLPPEAADLARLQAFAFAPPQRSSTPAERDLFERYLPHLTLLVNCIYWTARYPRLVTREWVRRAWAAEARPTLRVIGDISCDVGGAIEVTLPGEPWAAQWEPLWDSASHAARAFGVDGGDLTPVAGGGRVALGPRTVRLYRG